MNWCETYGCMGTASVGNRCQKHAPMRMPMLAEGAGQDGEPFFRMIDANTGNPWRGPVSLVDAAYALGLNPATLRQQIARGKLSATKRGRDWFVTRTEVERYRRESRRIPA